MDRLRCGSVHGLYRSCLLRRLRGEAKPGAHARIWVAVLGDVADDGDRIGTRGIDRVAQFERDAADGDQRDGSDALLPLRDAIQAPAGRSASPSAWSDRSVRARRNRVRDAVRSPARPRRAWTGRASGRRGGWRERRPPPDPPGRDADAAPWLRWRRANGRSRRAWRFLRRQDASRITATACFMR